MISHGIRVCCFLLAVATLAYGSTPAVLNYGPVIGVGCDSFEISMPNPNMYPNVTNRYYYVYSAGDTAHGYSSGEFYTNSMANFMNMADNQGFVYYKIDGGRWSPITGKLHVNISLYSGPARNAACYIGSGNMTSNDYFPRNYTDTLAPKKWVVAVGGNVTMTYQIIPSAVKSPAASFSTTVFQSRTVNLYFPPNRNMWSNKETFTNRYFVREDVTGRFYAPLFDSTGNELFWNSATAKLAPYTAPYDAVIQMWGSNGFSFTTNTYSSPNVGIDVGLGLTCTPPPDPINLTPPVCPLVVTCTLCTRPPVTVSGKCNQPVVVKTNSTCLTLTVNDNLGCTSPGNVVQA